MGWNLALDQNHGPFLGYCENCRGLVDIDTVTKKITFNPELIALAHAGKFLGKGAVRISAPAPFDGNYTSIAYLNTDGTVVHVAENTGPSGRNFVVPTASGDFFRVTVPAGGAVTVAIPPVIQ
jgi:glucosylceramidase